MDAENALRRHPIPGQVVQEWVIPPREYAAVVLKQGQVLRFVDVEGQQVPDLVCFNEHDLMEALSTTYSMIINKRRELRQGHILYSIICRPMLTIVGYSNELSFSYGPMCSEELNRLRYGVAGTRNCRDNLAMALAPWAVDRRQIPNAFQPFMNVDVDPEGTLDIKEPTSRPGDYYDLRAEMDLVAAVSNCPQDRNPVNGFRPTAMGIVIYEPAAGTGTTSRAATA